MIEHALYASARSHRRDGYQVVAASPGIAQNDLRELPLWCPSHNSLLNPTVTSPSINAHALPSGAHCVARSFAAQAEYSGRGGTHVVSHVLVLSAGDFARFAHNPFAVMRAAVAAGQSTASVAAERTLKPFSLMGRARPFDGAVVRQALAKHPLHEFARALEICLAADTAAIATTDDAATLLAALLNCLPIGLRATISLATGLVYSPTRPYRWIAQNPDILELRHLESAYGVSVASLTADGKDAAAPPDGFYLQHAWAEFVYHCLSEAHHTELEKQIQRMGDVQNVAELDSLAAKELSVSGTQSCNAAPIAGTSAHADSLTPVEALR